MVTKRIMALDIGDKTIGIAVTDPFNSYAVPSETYWRVRKLDADVAAIVKIIREKDCGSVVCGLPLNFDGSESVQTQKTQRFIDTLKSAIDIPVYIEDERFTTMEAEKDLTFCGVKGKNKKKTVDSIAASYILEGYLNKIKKQGEAEMAKKEMQENRKSEEEYSDVIELVTENGEVEEFIHYGTLQYQGEWYCLLAPASVDDEDEVSVSVFKIEGDENNERIVALEDEILMEEVFAEFMHQMEDSDLEELEELDEE